MGGAGTRGGFQTRGWGEAQSDFSGQLAPQTLTAAVHGQRTAGSEQWEAQSQSRGDQNTHRASMGHWATQTLDTDYCLQRPSMIHTWTT